MPTLFPCLRIERDQIVIRCLEEEPVVIHAHTTIPDVSSALRVPEVMPEHAAGEGIYGPCVVGRGHIEGAVHLKDYADDARAVKAADLNSFFRFATDDRPHVIFNS